MTSNENLPTAASIMTTDVVTVKADTSVPEAAGILLEKRVSNAPVVEHDMTRDLLVGFISEKDIMQCYADGVFYDQPDLRISQIMRPHPVSVSEEADVYTLAAIFMQHGYRHLPVTRAHMLQGVVSRRDVLAALVASYHEWNAQEGAEKPDLKAIFTPRFIVG